MKTKYSFNNTVHLLCKEEDGLLVILDSIQDSVEPEEHSMLSEALLDHVSQSFYSNRAELLKNVDLEFDYEEDSTESFLKFNSYLKMEGFKLITILASEVVEIEKIGYLSLSHLWNLNFIYKVVGNKENEIDVALRNIISEMNSVPMIILNAVESIESAISIEQVEPQLRLVLDYLEFVKKEILIIK